MHTLAVVVAADLSHEELIAHLAHGTVPDLAELEVFAALNGLTRSGGEQTRRVLATSAAVAPPSRPAAPSVGVRTRSAGRDEPAQRALPPVTAPGSWPYGDIRDILGSEGPGRDGYAA